MRILGVREMLDMNFWRAIFAEILVSGIYIFIVCGQLVPINDELPTSRLHGSLTVAFTVAVLASAFWEISGGHFNPAVSFALLIMGKIKTVRFLLYVVAQCAGSVGGAAILYAVTPSSHRSNGNLGALTIHEEINAGVAVFIEIVLTFQFIFVVISSTDPIRSMNGFQAPFAIGLSVGIGLLMGVPYTGGCLNPIRAFGPAVLMKQLQHQWVYWVGPMLGAGLAALSYKYVLKLKETANYDEEQNVTVNEFVKPTRLCDTKCL